MKSLTTIPLTLVLAWVLVNTHSAELRPKPSATKPEVFVRGYVGDPKTVEIPSGSTKLDILHAVAEAGDFNQIADTRNVVIILNYGKKDEEVVVIDIENRKHEDDTFHHFVRAGDVIHVPRRRFD